MAITWGSWASGGGIQSRLGVEFRQSPGTVTSATSSVTVYADVYLEVNGWVNDSESTLSAFGSFSGSQTIAVNRSGKGVGKVGTFSRTVPLSYTLTAHSAFGASLSSFIGGSPTVTADHYAPRRPYQLPAAPTGVTVTRVSDTSQLVSWTRNASSSAPYERVYVERWDVATNRWTQIMSGSGDRTSWTDSTTSSNNRYQYRVRATNSSGTSGWGTSARISTTPAAPTSVRATKAVSDITVSWTITARTGAHSGHEIQDSPDGASWSTIGTVAAGVSEWVHQSPSTSVTHRYRVRATESGSLYSGWSATSNVVALLAPPNAPTPLSPVGEPADADSSITLTWRHNPTDSTDQTWRSVRHRRVGTTSWTTVTGTATAQSLVIAPGVYPNGTPVEWQVQTRGQHATASPWSALATFPTDGAPQAAVTAPADGAVHPSSSLTVEWSYHDPEGTAQSSWRLWLQSGGATLHTRSGSGAAGSLDVPVRLADGQSYTVRVQVRDGAGQWSEVSSSTFTVAYVKPPVPVMDTEWDQDAGTLTVAVANPGWGEGEAEPVGHELWRSLDRTAIDAVRRAQASGLAEDLAEAERRFDQTARLVATVPTESAMTDQAPAVGVESLYRLVTVSALPSSAASPITLVSTTPHGSWVWINAGPGWGDAVRVRHGAELEVAQYREKELRRFAGRRWPTEFSGEGEEHSVTVSVRLDPSMGSASFDELAEMLDRPAPLLYRDPTGRRWEVSSPGLREQHRGVIRHATFTVTRVGDGDG